MSFIEEAPQETTLEAGGHVKGVAIAEVRQNKDGSGLGRVKVSYPWHSQPGESYWARVAMPMTGKNRGMYFIPEVGDEVLVAFERGDMRFPYVVGSLWNGEDKAPQANGDGKNDIRQIRSRDSHMLTFNDGADGLVQLEFKDGQKLLLNRDGIKLQDTKGNSLVIESASGAITITAATKLTLKAPQVAIEASGTIDVKASATLGLRGTVVNIN
jgi:uncharacterized protein involved in type VI secretion and phage assembly